MVDTADKFSMLIETKNGVCYIAQPFDGDDFHPGHILHRQFTGRHRLAISQDLANPTLLRTVAVFDAFQTQVVPQDVEQRGFGGDLEME